MTGVVPTCFGHLYTMLPKDEHSRRPIGITCLMFRAWSRIRLRLLIAWSKLADLPGAWGTSTKRTDFAAWAVAARAEYAATVRCCCASLLLDLHKFYEYVSHSQLMRVARHYHPGVCTCNAISTCPIPADAPGSARPASKSLVCA
eukprot:2768130-Amphidinium_carterae.1